MSKKLFKIIVRSERIFEFLKDKFYGFFIKQSMGSCGKNVTIKPSTSIFCGIENFYFADDVNIARNALIYSTIAKVYISEKVVIAPYLKIITGNHRFDKIGHFVFDADYEKSAADDKDVVIESDCWFGINVTILSGVTIGRGTIIAAGAVVIKSCPPYSIIGGSPARILKYRFSVDDILEHETILYPIEKRYSREDLIAVREKYERQKS